MPFKLEAGALVFYAHSQKTLMGHYGLSLKHKNQYVTTGNIHQGMIS